MTLLWALANDGFSKPGYGDVTPLLAAGRTSVATDPAIDREFYRLAGFRFLGKRAVRIDILERLADLIRPALQWKPGTQGARPEAAYDGRRFITTTGMLSILGATQDDIEEILKGLGYRADAVPAEEAQAHIAALDTQQPEAGGKDGNGPVVEVVVSRTAADWPHKPAEEAGAAPAEAAAQPVATEAVAAASDESTDSEAPKADAAAESTEETEAPRPVLLWRPGGRQDAQRGPRNAPGEGRGRREGGNRNARSGEQQEGEGRQAKGHRGKPGHPGKGGAGKGAAGRGGKGGQSEANRGSRNERPQRKEKPLDPDSPFAALAALRDQLKK